VFECRLNIWIVRLERFVSFFEVLSHKQHSLSKRFGFSSLSDVHTPYVVSSESFLVGR